MDHIIWTPNNMHIKHKFYKNINIKSKERLYLLYVYTWNPKTKCRKSRISTFLVVGTEKSLGSSGSPLMYFRDDIAAFT